MKQVERVVCNGVGIPLIGFGPGGMGYTPNGKLLVDAVHDALDSFNNGMMVEFDRSWLTTIRQASLSWLQNAIA